LRFRLLFALPYDGFAATQLLAENAIGSREQRAGYSGVGLYGFFYPLLPLAFTRFGQSETKSGGLLKT
jgi:hypothetical protein